MSIITHKIEIISNNIVLPIKNLIILISVIYLTSTTAAAARKQKHKSLSSDNVFSALEEIEFESFIQPLRESLESFRKISKDKKATKTNGNKSINETNGTDIDDMDDDANESHAEEMTNGTEIEEE